MSLSSFLGRIFKTGMTQRDFSEEELDLGIDFPFPVHLVLAHLLEAQRRKIVDQRGAKEFVFSLTPTEKRKLLGAWLSIIAIAFEGQRVDTFTDDIIRAIGAACKDTLEKYKKELVH